MITSEELQEAYGLEWIDYVEYLENEQNMSEKEIKEWQEEFDEFFLKLDVEINAMWSSGEAISN